MIDQKFKKMVLRIFSLFIISLLLWNCTKKEIPNPEPEHSSECVENNRVSINDTNYEFCTFTNQSSYISSNITNLYLEYFPSPDYRQVGIYFRHIPIKPGRYDLTSEEASYDTSLRYANFTIFDHDAIISGYILDSTHNNYVELFALDSMQFKVNFDVRFDTSTFTVNNLDSIVCKAENLVFNY